MKKKTMKAARPRSSKRPIHLRTIGDLVDAHEWLFNEQREGKIDPKTADALNTTLKGSVYLNAKLRLDMAKIMVQAQIKKIRIPDRYLPPFDEPAAAKS
jgi:hypothetical protein